MGRKKKRRRLHVAMNGQPVGRLDRASSGQLTFQYEQSWLNSAKATPVSLSLPLSREPYSGDLVSNYFDNLLPDNDRVRDRMQERLGANSTRPFDLLEIAGRDCVGALQFVDSAGPTDVQKIEADPVSDEEIERTLKNIGINPLGMERDVEFRISVAGAQDKTAFLHHDAQWKRPRGATPTTHLFKLPIGKVNQYFDLSESVENEWLCLRMAAGFGLKVPEAKIRDFGASRVLVVERFDRMWSEHRAWLARLPQEDMCQALGKSPSQKYEANGGPGIPDVMTLLNQSTDPQTDRNNFFRAMIVYWILAAIDGHGKNFSIFLSPGGRIRLAPFYDILSAYPAIAAGGVSEHDIKMAMAAIGKNKHYKWNEIQRRHWISTAKKCRLAEETVEAIIGDLVDRAETAVDKARKELPRRFPRAVSEPVFDGALKAVEKLRE